MKWSNVAFTALMLGAIFGACWSVRGCTIEADARYEAEYQEWNSYVALHHCSVAPTKWYETQRWQCDGFQIEHR
jgi:hypothetical protein